MTDPDMDSQINPDLELARRAAAGDEAAWRAIYVATRERLFSLLVYQLGHRDEAMDVLQDTYVSAIRSIGRYRGEGSLEAWMAGIAYHQAQGWKRRFLKKRKRTEVLADDFDPAAPPGPDHEAKRQLVAALAKLPERQRHAVLLHEWMGYSFADIAGILGTSESTARVHAFRGREALRALLGDSPAHEAAASLMEQRS